ncbi:MAG: hypothetical protein AB4368_10525 [Xenococcaceae cyanobacterium]
MTRAVTRQSLSPPPFTVRQLIHGHGDRSPCPQFSLIFQRGE